MAGAAGSGPQAPIATQSPRRSRSWTLVAWTRRISISRSTSVHSSLAPSSAQLGFNLGIEAAQVGIALVFLDVAYSLRTFGMDARGLVPVGSAVALGLASLWFIDRALAVPIAPF